MRTSLTCPSVEVWLLAVTEKEPLRPGGKSDRLGGSLSENSGEGNVTYENKPTINQFQTCIYSNIHPLGIISQ